jgi:hypothetical protein
MKPAARRGADEVVEYESGLPQSMSPLMARSRHKLRPLFGRYGWKADIIGSL